MLQQRIDEATAALAAAKEREATLRQSNLDLQVKWAEVNRQNLALKREKTFLGEQVKKQADFLARGKEINLEAAEQYRQHV